MATMSLRPGVIRRGAVLAPRLDLDHWRCATGRYPEWAPRQFALMRRK
jgi:hypothetical protein